MKDRRETRKKQTVRKIYTKKVKTYEGEFSKHTNEEQNTYRRRRYLDSLKPLITPLALYMRFYCIMKTSLDPDSLMVSLY